MDSTPLSADEIVWQIVKHIVETIATKRNRLLGSSFGNKLTEDIQSGILVEKERRSGSNVQGCK